MMNCRYCGSDKIFRSHRKGLYEGFWLRLFRRAPYRCHSCGIRYIAQSRHGTRHPKQIRDESLASYLGLRGSEHRLRRWVVAMAITVLFLVISIVFIVRILQ